jgi:hypothetical protein
MSHGLESGTDTSVLEHPHSVLYVTGDIGAELAALSPAERNDILSNPSLLLEKFDTSREDDPHKKEQYALLEDTVISLGKHATHKTGSGTANDFFMVPRSVEGSLSEAGIFASVGIRRTRTEQLSLSDGTSYEGIRLDDPDRPNPVAFFFKGAIIQSIDAYKSRLAFGTSRVPEVYAVIATYGIPHPETGETIPGTEKMVTNLYAVMEAVPGKNVFQICDPDRQFTAGRYSARKKDSIRDFLTNNDAYIRSSIRAEAQRNPLLYSWDFDAIRRQIRENIAVAGDVSIGGIGILGNDAHPGNMLISPDGSTVHPIDRDMARLFTEMSFVQYPENYRYEEKSSLDNPQIFLPDDTSRITDENWERYWQPRFGGRGDLLDAITLANLFIDIIENECTHIRDEQSPVAA